MSCICKNSSIVLKEPTCEELIIQGNTYFLWKNIPLENAKIHLISHSASNGRFAIGRFKEVLSRFIDVFGKTKENIRFNIFETTPLEISITNNFQKTIKALEECSKSNPLF